MKLNYTEQLRHPKWQRRRLEMLNQANFECDECGAKDITLHVHHKQYVKGRMAWEYADDELQVLCEDCHAQKHEDEKIIKTLLEQINSKEIITLLAGYILAKGEGKYEELAIHRGEEPFAFAGGYLAGMVQERCDLQAACDAGFAVFEVMSDAQRKRHACADWVFEYGPTPGVSQ